jgi:hypothetical protein
MQIYNPKLIKSKPPKNIIFLETKNIYIYILKKKKIVEYEHKKKINIQISLVQQTKPNQKNNKNNYYEN